MTLLADEPVESPVAAAPARASDAPLLLPAVLSLAAAAIHFAFAPAHFDEKTLHGAFFLGVGAYQAAWAVAALAGLRVRLLGLLQAVPLVVWALSRTVGVDGYDADSVGYPDALASGLEVAVLFALVGRVSLRRPLVLGLGVVVGAATLFALTPPFADAHDHGTAESASGTTGGGADAPALTPCERSGPPASPAQVTDSAGHSHRGPLPQQPIDQAARVQLAAQQELARAVADKYPTVAAATKAGYRKSTPYIPCIGAHYTNIGLVARFDPSLPSELLFDGTAPESKLVGLSYLVYHPGGAPEGFAGPNDVWHQHNANGGLCFDRTGLVLAAEDSSAEQCRALGGFKRELTDVWMLHDWIVPGWECSWGVFAPECPELGGTTGLSAWD